MKNNITIIMGSHSRHLWLVDNIISTFNSYDFRIIVMERDDSSAGFKNHSDKRIADLLNLHFLERSKWEEKYFPISGFDLSNKKNITKVLNIKSSELNSEATKNWYKEQKSSLTFTFGCLILDNDFLKLIGENSLNLHLGLSPWYKGSATLFWPNYNLEPEKMGLTLHRLSDVTDGGGIIHQFVPEISLEDHFQKHYSCYFVLV